MSREFNVNAVNQTVLTSESGLRVTVLNVGAALQSIRVPVGSGHLEAILGYDDPESYRADTMYMGSTIGRFANRLAAAKFGLGGKLHQLESNDPDFGHCLHGGSLGFHAQLWSTDAQVSSDSVRFCYESPDGESGFPGNLSVSVTYQIVDNWSLCIDFRATTDLDTVVSLANHAYFNLDPRRRPINGHVLQMNAEAYTPLDSSRIPIGSICSVADSRFDFRAARALGDGQSVRPIDQNYVLDGAAGSLREAATLHVPSGPVSLTILTTQPCLQLYTGEYLNTPFQPRQGVCLEAQGFPNAPNEPRFPSAQLKPGETYSQRTIYQFKVKPSP